MSVGGVATLSSTTKEMEGCAQSVAALTGDRSGMKKATIEENKTTKTEESL
jgi:hypothetical protein